MSLSPWEQHLNQFTAKDLIPKGFKLQYAKANDKILATLQLLINKKLLCVPIYDEEQKKFIGLVDVLDMLSLIVTMSDMKQIVDMMNGKETDWSQYISQEHKIIGQQKVSDLINASTRNPWTPISHRETMKNVIKLFADNLTLHRSPIIDDNGNVIGLISQSRIIEWFSHEITKFPEIQDRKISEWLNKCDKSPISVDNQMKTLDAYRMMLEKNISGVGVIDQKGQLVGCLSGSDIKGSLEHNIFTDLYLPIELYLQKSTFDFTRDKSDNPIFCTLEYTMGSLIKQIVANHVHRLFIVDSKIKPITVISLGDIIAVLSGDGK